MPTSPIRLAVALLPALILASACDDKQVPGPDTGDFAGTEGDTDTDDSDSDSAGHDVPPNPTVGPDEPVDPTEGDDTGSTGEPGDTEGDEPGDDTEGEPQPPPPAPKPDPAVPCADLEWPASAACTTEGGDDGLSFCLEIDGEQVWTDCRVDVACYPGDGIDQGCLGEICAFDGEELYWYAWSEPDCNTPLVLNFDGAPLRFDTATAASFDISGVGECLSTDWPALPWLALDRDGDGAIDSGRELFGSGTVLRGGQRASHGFEALAELDAERDGRVDAADPAFAELVLWSDGDGDRRGALSELVPVTAVDLVAIHLDVTIVPECDARGNCGRERARFEFRAPTGELRSGEVIDVYLACQ